MSEWNLLTERAYKLILGKSKTIGIHQIGSLFSPPPSFDKAEKKFPTSQNIWKILLISEIFFPDKRNFENFAPKNTLIFFIFKSFKKNLLFSKANIYHISGK